MDEEKEIPTNYTKEYAVTRGWGNWEIVREFVQNSLDATGTVSVEIRSEGLLITDRGKGFNAVNLLMGTTTKSECDRGRFGEGLKIACLAALNLGYAIEIDTDSMHVTPVLKELEIEDLESGELIKTQIMVFRYRKIPPAGGTRILIKGYTDQSYLGLFNLETNKKIVHKREMDECKGKRYMSYMIDEPEKRIYVRNIFVQAITDKEALYSYDLFKVRLSTDRNIPNTVDIFKEIGRLWSLVSDVRMIEAFLKHVKAEGYEVEAKLDSTLMQKFATSNSWINAFNSVFPNSFLYTGEKDSKLAEYHTKFQKKSVYLPSNIRYPLENIGIDSDREVLARLKHKLPELPKSKTNVQAANLEYLEMIHYRLKAKHFTNLNKVFLSTAESMVDSAGKVVNDNIYIRQDKADTMVNMIDIYGHEATHIVFPDLDDNTDAFYARIGEVMAIITKVVATEPIKPPKGVVW